MIGTITINRPHVRNAIDRATALAISEAVDGMVADDSVRVVVLTGAGGAFWAGMDLKAFARGERPTLPGRGLAGITEYHIPIPFIAAVSGYALAGGCELALTADIIVADRSATFGSRRSPKAWWPLAEGCFVWPLRCRMGPR